MARKPAAAAHKKDEFARVCTLPGVGSDGNQWKRMPSRDTSRRLRLLFGGGVAGIKEMDDLLELEPLEVLW